MHALGVNFVVLGTAAAQQALLKQMPGQYIPKPRATYDVLEYLVRSKQTCQQTLLYAFLLLSHCTSQAYCYAASVRSRCQCQPVATFGMYYMPSMAARPRALICCDICRVPKHRQSWRRLIKVSMHA